MIPNKVLPIQKLDSESFRLQGVSQGDSGQEPDGEVAGQGDAENHHGNKKFLPRLHVEKGQGELASCKDE
jgi:hypothetical protein